MSPTLSVPVMTMTVETTPCFGSLLASRITPTADLFGLYLSSRISAWRRICSNNWGIPWPVLDEMPMTGTSPHRSSAVSQCFAISVLIWSILLPGLSILVIAMMIGTPAAFAWPIDSTVCGITLSSAAITMTAILVSLAHLALRLVKSSCQGVSMKVIGLPL